MLNLYANIKRLRIAAGLSQDELAKRAGYTDRSSIAKIEAGKIDLPQSKIAAFADIFGVSTLELMGEELEASIDNEVASLFHGLPDDKKELALNFLRLLSGK